VGHRSVCDGSGKPPLAETTRAREPEGRNLFEPWALARGIGTHPTWEPRSGGTTTRYGVDFASHGGITKWPDRTSSITSIVCAAPSKEPSSSETPNRSGLIFAVSREIAISTY